MCTSPRSLDRAINRGVTRTLVAGCALAPLAIIAACSSFGGSDNDVPDAGPAIDASPLDAHDEDAALDAGTTDAADAFDGCTPLIDDDFTGNVLDPSWIVAGDPPKLGFNGELVLLEEGQGGASAVWRAAPSPAAATLRIEVELHITPANQLIGDGMAVAWASPIAGDRTGQFLSHVGGAGQDMAICPDGANGGPDGAMGLAILTYDASNSGFPPRHLSILDQKRGSCASTLASPVVIPDGGVIPVSLQLGGGRLSGTEIVTIQKSLERNPGDIGWVGFSAGSTGAGNSHQAIAHVHVSSCQ